MDERSVLPGFSFGLIPVDASHKDISIRLLAAFSTAKRLIATLVNEKILKLIKFPLNDHQHWYLHVNENNFVPDISISNGNKDYLNQTFALQLHSKADFPRFCLDPDDIIYPIVSVTTSKLGSVQVLPSEIFAWVVDRHKLIDSFANLLAEIQSSVDNQEQIFRDFDGVYPSLHSPAIKWEESIISGHATHPMHKTRLGFSLAESKMFCAEFRPIVYLRFLAVPRTFMQLNGNFDTFMKENIGRVVQNLNITTDEVLILVHPKQVETLAKMLPENGVPYRLLPESVNLPCCPQTSIRSVSPLDPATLQPLPFHIKMGLNVRTTSCLRTVSKYSVYNGPHLTEPITKMLKHCDWLNKRLFPDKNSEFEVSYEIASAGLCHGISEDVGKHLACVFRINPEIHTSVAGDLPHTTSPDDRYIVACSLVEQQKSGVTNVINSFGLQDVQQRQEFLREYVSSYFYCFLTPLLCHGFAFEGHGQNTLLKIRLNHQDEKKWKIVGFCIRDLGGLQIHLETFLSSFPDGTVSLDLLPNSSIVVSSLDKAVENLFHCAIQNQLHRLIRALDLHYDSSGWRIVYQQLSRFLDIFESNCGDSELMRTNLKIFKKVWFGEKVGYKAFMRMKFDGLYRDYIFEPISNILLKGAPTTAN